MFVSCAWSRGIFCHFDVHAIVTPQVPAWPRLSFPCPSCFPLALQMSFILQMLMFIQTAFLRIIAKSSMVGACGLCMVQRQCCKVCFIHLSQTKQNIIEELCRSVFLWQFVFCVGSCTRVIISFYLWHMHGSILVRVWSCCVMV